MWLYLAALLGLYYLRRWYRERQTVENLTEKKNDKIEEPFTIAPNTSFHPLGRCFNTLCAGDIQNDGSQLLRCGIHQLLCPILGLWGLVNNAGIGIPVAPNEWLTKDDFAKVISVNLLGLIDVTLHMLPLVKKARGRVVNVTSVMGRVACFGGGYCPSKFGAEAFSDSLRRELRPFGVQVSIIEPGGFLTPIVKKVEEDFQNMWSRVRSDIKECYGQQYFNSYSKYFQDCLNRGSTNLHLVTDNIEHALKSRYPRTRYPAGWDAKLFYIPLTYFPTSVADYVLTRKRPKPAQAV